VKLIIEVPDESEWLNTRQTQFAGGRVGDSFPPEVWSTGYRRGKHLGAAAYLAWKNFDESNRDNFVTTMLGEMLAYGREVEGWDEATCQEITARILRGLGQGEPPPGSAGRLIAAIDAALADVGEYDFDDQGPRAVIDLAGFLQEFRGLPADEVARILNTVELTSGRYGESVVGAILQDLGRPSVNKALANLERRR
jgi:hypothetical protein